MLFGRVVREGTIDRAGRLLVPKELRDRLHLRPESRLRLSDEHERLVITPEPAEAAVREKAGVLVLTGQLEAKVPDHRRLRDERVDRWARK